MIVPSYWAEARKQYRRQGKQITVRRFGWSEASQEEAQAMAESRAAEALEKAVAGNQILRREPVVAYNGAQGIPIREEVVARHGDVVITRNGYGAKCLNTPDVLIADIDFPEAGSLRQKLGLFAAMVASSAILGWLLKSATVGLGGSAFALFAAAPLGNFLSRALIQVSGGPEKQAESRITQFLKKNPAWNLRMYRTPAGLRLVATHRPFQPDDAVVQEFFRAMATDPVYVRMCLNQQCFRARLTAKPWRIGIPGHMKPRPGVWPVRPERLAERAAWLADYDARAASFAACRFVKALGSGATDPKVAIAINLHDAEAKALTPDLPIA